MKTKTYLILPYCISLLLISFGACKHVSKTAKASDTLAALKLINEKNMEYIDWDSVKINGTLPMVNKSATSVYHILGKPDSIVTPNMQDDCGASYFEDNFKYVYIRGSRFEMRNDSLVVTTLNFKGSALKLAANNLIIDSNTTLSSLSNTFPVAVKNQQTILLEDNQKAIQISINTGKELSEEDKWLLFFRKGKLIRIEYWIEC